jgi:predicted dehydrogenase
MALAGPAPAGPALPAGARLPVALIGAGAVGRMHLQRLLAHDRVCLAGIADPAPAAQELARRHGVPWAADAAELLQRARPGAAIIATPNMLHADGAIAALARGVPVLVEKPIADSVAEAARIDAAARAAGVPVLVGHQRRHGTAVQRARRLIRDGAIGRPVCATVMATWLKPDTYFELAWRRQRGGGPVLINAIHDVDLLRFLIGEVHSVQAMTSRAHRGFEVEDTAAAVLALEGGVLATLLATDTAVSPWNYDLAAGESELYAQQPVDALMICGTEGSLSLPRVQLWRHADPARRGWHERLACEQVALHRADPYAEQLRHLRAVAEGDEAPLCSAEDATGTLRATLALLHAAEAQRPIPIETGAQPCPA